MDRYNIATLETMQGIMRVSRRECDDATQVTREAMRKMLWVSRVSCGSGICC